MTEAYDPVLDEIRKTKADLERRLAEASELEREQLGDEGRAFLWPELPEVLEMRTKAGPRYSTGLAGLDAKIEGGLHAGVLCVVQGAPGIGKTMLATQIALHMAKTCAVACLYADEGMQGAAVRIGQQLGVSRETLLNENGNGVDAARKAIGPAPFFRFLDPSRQESTVEFMFEKFNDMAPVGLQRVYLVDSAQVVRCAKVTPRLDRRQAVSTLLVELRELALRYRAIVIVVSQVGRGAYRSKKEDERIDPLAAGLESSAIEFMADLILHLDGKPKKDNPAVTLRCPKNRLSAEGVFDMPLVMDFPRARFLEADPVAVEADRAIARDNELRTILPEIIKALADFPDGASGRDVEREVGGRAFDVRAALKFGVGSGVLARIRRSGKGGGMLYMVKS